MVLILKMLLAPLFIEGQGGATWADWASSAWYGSDQSLEGTGHAQLACCFPGAVERSWTTEVPCLLHPAQNKAGMKEALGYVEDSRAWGGG